MADEQTLKFLLSTKYDPTNESKPKFQQSYQYLVEHRDKLRRKIEAKQKKRADIEKSKGQSVSRGQKKKKKQRKKQTSIPHEQPPPS